MTHTGINETHKTEGDLCYATFGCLTSVRTQIWTVVRQHERETSCFCMRWYSYRSDRSLGRASNFRQSCLVVATQHSISVKHVLDNIYIASGNDADRGAVYVLSGVYYGGR